ncbi:GntR family transcriptional regulator [Ruminococcus gauvreauii]|uniref:GntR family transcriptional regulator n=1 Tax=Ruminococcus gauvreauii TaxID=438033 RepID=UPI003983FCD8
MRKETLAEKAYRYIKEWILSGDVEFGAIIDQQELAGRFGFSSITPVREALILLQKDNLVDIIPRKGIFVSRMSLEEVIDNFQIREIIEPTVLQEIALDIPGEVLQKYRDLYEDWSVHPEKLEMKSYLQADSDFHLALLAPLGNSSLGRILETIYVENTRYRLLSLKQRNFGGSINEHLQILDALEARDVTLAVTSLKEHIQKSKIALLMNKS